MARRILAILMMIAVMFTIVGCGNNTNNEGNVADVENNGSMADNDKPNDNKTELIEDDYYEPNTENLVGIALYPVKEPNDYPYDLGEKVTDMSKWKFIYYVSDSVYAYDDNIIDRTGGYGIYVSNSGYYWGYVYQQGGSYYIVSTHDYCDIGDKYDSRRIYIDDDTSVCIRGYQMDVPDSYVFEFSWNDLKTVVMKDSKIYDDSEIPNEIMLPDDTLCNYLYVYGMKNSAKIEEAVVNKISYEKVDKNGGTFKWAFDGYKDGESYQYYIDVVHPNPQ